MPEQTRSFEVAYSPELALIRQTRELLQSNGVPFRESGILLWKRFHFTPTPSLMRQIQRLESDWVSRDAW